MSEQPKETFISIYKEFITRPGADNLLKWLEGSDFFTAPASTRFHLSHEGGLCQHSLNVYDELCHLCVTYKNIVPVKPEQIAVSALLHDVCKVNFYGVEMRNKKNDAGKWESVPAYKVDEKFCYGGHGAKSVFLIGRFMTLDIEEAVAIQCHMGPYDRSPTDLSLGAAYDQHPLALLLHMADMVSAHIIETKTEENHD